MDEKCKFHGAIESRVQRNENDINTMWELIDKIRNRPPVWMSLAFAAALGVIGWLIKGS